MPQYGQSYWPEASDSVNQVGSSMANLALQQAMGRERAMQYAQQLALQRAQVGFEGQRVKQEGQRTQAEVDELKQRTADAQQSRHLAEMVGRMRAASQSPVLNQAMQDPRYAMNMGQDMTEAGVIAPNMLSLAAKNPLESVSPDQLRSALNAAISGNLYGQGASIPSGAVDLAKPVIMGPNETAFNPQSMQQMSQTGPAQITPYQQSMLGIDQQKLDLLGAYQAGMVAARNEVNRIAGGKAAASPNLLGYKGPGSDEDASGQVQDSNILTATNPKTGQRVQSTDGGKTWTPIR